MKRNERFERKNDGAVGIGTLIVFIAMVLVAAIAAAVLINTSGSLQDRAQKTGAEATEDVSGGIKVQQIEGRDNKTADGQEHEITEIKAYLALHSGTTAVDIEQELVIHITWNDREPGSSTGGVADFVHFNNTGVEKHSLCKFNHTIVADPHGSFFSSGSLDQDSVIAITLYFVQTEAGYTAPTGGGLDPASDGTLKFLISSGVTPTVKGFNVPGSMPAGGGWVELY